MEKCPESDVPIKMLPLNAGWADLGSWDAVWQSSESDDCGNVRSGDTLIAAGTNNTYINASSRLVAAVGVSNLVIVETPDAVLVADKGSSQDVKSVIQQLKDSDRDEKDFHRKVNRPWGWYDNVDQGDCFKVKRIRVKPGASLSLQMHNHRAEHWIVVKGIAEITNGDKVIVLKENQSTYVPKGQIHRLTNPGCDPLEIIEVQSGDYLGEDDIVRFEDKYGRQ
jgi:mannose-1-phosphate guanylyltransferase/mannose-6-phosphate isomerase